MKTVSENQIKSFEDLKRVPNLIKEGLAIENPDFDMTLVKPFADWFTDLIQRCYRVAKEQRIEF